MDTDVSYQILRMNILIAFGLFADAKYHVSSFRTTPLQEHGIYAYTPSFTVSLVIGASSFSSIWTNVHQ